MEFVNSQLCESSNSIQKPKVPMYTVMPGQLLTTEVFKQYYLLAQLLNVWVKKKEVYAQNIFVPNLPV